MKVYDALKQNPPRSMGSGVVTLCGAISEHLGATKCDYKKPFSSWLEDNKDALSVSTSYAPYLGWVIDNLDGTLSEREDRWKITKKAIRSPRTNLLLPGPKITKEKPFVHPQVFHFKLFEWLKDGGLLRIADVIKSLDKDLPFLRLEDVIDADKGIDVTTSSAMDDLADRIEALFG